MLFDEFQTISEFKHNFNQKDYINLSL